LQYLIILIFWFIGWFLFRNVKFLSYKKPKNNNFLISVIIPARNEEQNIGKILKTVKSQTLKPYEVIVVNDNSSDRTQFIAESYENVKVISLNEEPPPSWVGKPWALWNGYLNSSGDLLLFLDADVELSENAIESILAEYEKHGGMISVWPYQRLERFYEHLTLPFNLIAVCSTNPFLSKKKKPIGAFGPIILTSRRDYESVGGHKEVKGEIIEDLKIGKLYVEKGINLTNLLGGNIVKFRMYPEGIKQMFEGLTKNMVKGAIHSGIWNFLLIFMWFTGIYSSINLIFSNINLINLIYYILFIFQIHVLTRNTGDYNFFDFILYPLHFCFFLLIFLISFIKAVFLKSIKWKGRKINV